MKTVECIFMATEKYSEAPVAYTKHYAELGVNFQQTLAQIKRLLKKEKI